MFFLIFICLIMPNTVLYDNSPPMCYTIRMHCMIERIVANTTEALFCKVRFQYEHDVYVVACYKIFQFF